jgi:predicted MFS family arabinose efflux permease
MIAADLMIDVKTAALLSTAFAFPYALIQPVLGVTGDFFGRTRLMNACVLVMAIAALICAVASNFTLLVAMRVVGRARRRRRVSRWRWRCLGDLVPMNQRQVAIARLLGIALTANVLGAAISGVIGDLFGWRGVFAILGTFSLAVSLLAFWSFRNRPIPPKPAFSRAAVIANFKGVFADPRAKVCFGAVFLEAIFIQGLFPYVALLLRGIGETRASIAGVLIGSFAVGGILYSLVVPYLVKAVPQRHPDVRPGASSRRAGSR